MQVSQQACWMLFLLASIHLVAELGHYLIGVVSKSVARDIHYGTLACFPKPEILNATLELCRTANVSKLCFDINVDGSQACTWEYTGLGMDYQLLAGPSFMAVFTLAGIFWGLAADRYNRVILLFFSTFIFSFTLAVTALATKFWHLVFFRMLLAAGVAGVAPLAPGMIFDVFSQRQRGLAMGLFHWGVYTGYGLSYAVGNYITKEDIFDQGWRATFVVSGMPGIFLAILFILTVKDPPKNKPASSSKDTSRVLHIHPDNGSMVEFVEDEDEDEAQVLIENENCPVVTSSWRLCLQPSILLLGLAACIRHSAGYCWGYNSALYFQTYYPDYNYSWWLTCITIFGGTSGAVIGGFVSDRLVAKMGVASRALVLAGSQVLAAPFAFGLLYLDPPLAFFSLFIAYLFAEMWFGVVFAIFVELLPTSIRSGGLAVALFIINNVGGNLPVVVHPLSAAVGYRGAISILYPGALLTSSVVFFLTYLSLTRK